MEQPFGQVAGRPTLAFVLDGGAGVTARVTDFGARLVELHVPGRDGTPADVVLGFDDAAAYAASDAYMGATVGRFGNRLARGRFVLDGVEHRVDANEGANTLHGGRHGWDRRIWSVDTVDEASVTFSTYSPNGDMGFPGACEVRCTYALAGARLRITMEAVSDAPTVVNMVHHSYVNLAGHASGDVMAQHLRIPADTYVPVDAEQLPTGEVLAVAGTPFDFRELHAIGRDLTGLPGTDGWDHNWCLRPPQQAGLVEALEAYDPASGRRMRAASTEPGVQVYTGGYLTDQVIGKGGLPYRKFAGFTLETQKFPDSPNVLHFPSTRLDAGELYRHEMLLEFSAD